MKGQTTRTFVVFIFYHPFIPLKKPISLRYGHQTKAFNVYNLMNLERSIHLRNRHYDLCHKHNYYLQILHDTTYMRNVKLSFLFFNITSMLFLWGNIFGSRYEPSLLTVITKPINHLYPFKLQVTKYWKYFKLVIGTYVIRVLEYIITKFGEIKEPRHIKHFVFKKLLLNKHLLRPYYALVYQRCKDDKHMIHSLKYLLYLQGERQQRDN